MGGDLIFTEEERRAFCVDPGCAEHGDGDNACALPRDRQQAEERGPSLLKEKAKPKTATAITETNDD